METFKVDKWYLRKEIKLGKVRIIKEFKSRWIYGEVELFLYQVAFGVSIRYLSCKGMGWMFRIYFGPVKVWFNLHKPKDEQG